MTAQLNKVSEELLGSPLPSGKRLELLKKLEQRLVEEKKTLNKRCVEL